MSVSGLGNDDCSASSATVFVRVNATRSILPSMKRQTVVDIPPSSRLAVVAIASNTGWTSVGELAITLRISAVAVCRSSACCVSRKSRAFSIAIAA